MSWSQYRDVRRQDSDEEEEARPRYGPAPALARPGLVFDQSLMPPGYELPAMPDASEISHWTPGPSIALPEHLLRLFMPVAATRILPLPDELLMRLFELCVDDDLSPEDAAVPELAHYARRIPFDIAAVCTRWRRLATATGLLWTRVVVDLDLVKTPPAAARWAAYVASHLERSRDHALDVAVVGSSRYPTAWNLVLPLIARSRKLVIQVTPQATLAFGLPPPAEPEELRLVFSQEVPHLQQLFLAYEPRFALEYTVRSPFFHSAPVLRTLAWDGPMLLAEGVYPAVEQVEFFPDGGVASGAELVELFRSFPRARRVTVNLGNFSGQPPFALSSGVLEEVSLGLTELDDVAANSMTFPSLSTADIFDVRSSQREDAPSVPPTGLAALLAGALVGVQHLYLQYAPDAALAGTLRACARLASLEFSRYSAASALFFDALARHELCICPRLESVRLSMFDESDACTALVPRLVALVRARTDHPEACEPRLELYVSDWLFMGRLRERFRAARGEDLLGVAICINLVQLDD